MSALFETDLPQDEIAALQADETKREEQERLNEKIEQRKREMDRKNRKMEKVNRRTVDAKSMVFESGSGQRFMVLNKTTLDKLDAPQDSVLDFVMQ